MDSHVSSHMVKTREKVATQLRSIIEGHSWLFLQSMNVLQKLVRVQRQWVVTVSVEEKKEARQRRCCKQFLDIKKWLLESHQTENDRGCQALTRLQKSILLYVGVIQSKLARLDVGLRGNERK